MAHLDLKPDNILLDDDGNAYLADFGIARAMASITPDDPSSSTLMAYTAPEQIRGASASPRADLYSFGLVVYEMLSGDHPFAGATPAEAGRRPSAPAAAEPGRDRPWPFSAGSSCVLLRATAKDPADRYPDVSTLVADLSRALLGVKAAGGEGWASRGDRQPLQGPAGLR